MFETCYRSVIECGEIQSILTLSPCNSMIWKISLSSKYFHFIIINFNCYFIFNVKYEKYANNNEVEK